MMFWRNEYGHEIVTFRDAAALSVAASAMASASGLGNTPAPERAALFAQLATISYEVADALIAARQKETE